jgi:glutamate synthase (NADPH/NADH) small chain
VEFRTGVCVGQEVSGLELKEGFDAVVLASGATLARDLNVPGRGLRGVHFALEFLRSQNARGETATEAVAARELSATGKTVAVIGAGLTGDDCVEVALLQGAREVHQLEILPQASKLAEPGTVPHDGERVSRRYCVATKELRGDGAVRELRAARVEWPGSANGKVMRELPASEFTVKADMVILAMGFAPAVDEAVAEGLGLTAGARAVNKDGTTSVPGVFAAGDLVTGPSYVVTAIASGRKAAAKVCEYLARLPAPSPVR